MLTTQTDNEQDPAEKSQWLACFYLRCLEVVLSVSLVTMELESEVPFIGISKVLINIGFAGSVVPILAMFSNTIMNRDCKPSLSVLAILCICSLHYIIGICAKIYVWPIIQLNRSMFFKAEVTGLILAIINALLISADFATTVYKGIQQQELAKQQLDEIKNG